MPSGWQNHLDDLPSRLIRDILTTEYSDKTHTHFFYTQKHSEGKNDAVRMKPAGHLVVTRALAESAHVSLTGARSAMRMVHGAANRACVVAVDLHKAGARVAHVGEALEGSVHRPEVGAAHIGRHCGTDIKSEKCETSILIDTLSTLHTNGHHRGELGIELRSVEGARHGRDPGTGHLAGGQTDPVDVAEEGVGLDLIGVLLAGAQTRLGVSNQQVRQQVLRIL